MRRNDINALGDGEAWIVGFNDKGRKTFGTRRITGAGEQHVLVGKTRIGYPGFDAVYDILIAIEFRRGCHRRNVGAASRF